MEFPEDILGYLGRFLKPKKYTLLNKFCRDAYFRKNGVSIRDLSGVKWKKLLRKYKVKILSMDSTEGKNFEKYKKIAKNVREIDFQAYSGGEEIYQYIIIRETFPNLARLKFYQSIYSFNRIGGSDVTESIADMTKFKPLKGTRIIIHTDTGNISVMEKLAEAGYPFEIRDVAGVESLPLSVRNNIKWLEYAYYNNIYSLDSFPNLKCVKISADNERYDIIIEQIKSHPKVKKIIVGNGTMFEYITKNNGQRVELVSDLDRFIVDMDSDYTLDKYNDIKKYYRGIVIEDDDARVIKKFVDLERKTTYKKKMTLYLDFDVEYKKAMQLLEHFDLSLLMSPMKVQFYMKRLKLHKARMSEGDEIELVYKIGSSKLMMVMDH